MGAIALIAGRWLGALRRRTHVAAVSAISFFAMALGAMALVVTLALLEGFQSTIRRQLAEAGVHAELRPRSGRTLPAGDWLTRLQAKHPDLEVRARSGGAVWCLAGDTAVPAELEVVDTLSRTEVNRVLAARLQAGIGMEIDLASPRLVLTPLGPTPVRRRTVIAAINPVRPAEERAVVYAPAALGLALLGPSAPRVVELRAGEARRAWDVASLVQGDVPDGVHVISFHDLNRPLLAALALERSMIGLGVALVIAVAGLNLLCNLALLGAEKRAEITVLSTLGLVPGRVFRLFLALGMAIGATGAVLGTAAGAAVAVILDRTEALPLPVGVFIVSHVPFAITPGMVVTVLLIAILTAFLATIAPARAAARRDFLAGLRYE